MRADRARPRSAAGRVRRRGAGGTGGAVGTITPGGRPGALVGGLDLEFFERELADEVGLEGGSVLGRHGISAAFRPRSREERSRGGGGGRRGGPR